MSIEFDIERLDALGRVESEWVSYRGGSWVYQAPAIVLHRDCLDTRSDTANQMLFNELNALELFDVDGDVVMLTVRGRIALHQGQLRGDQ